MAYLAAWAAAMAAMLGAAVLYQLTPVKRRCLIFLEKAGPWAI
jgi:hypothetical protein